MLGQRAEACSLAADLVSYLLSTPVQRDNMRRRVFRPGRTFRHPGPLAEPVVIVVAGLYLMTNSGMR